MSYLASRRGQIVLSLTLICSLLLFSFPSVDLAAAALFYDSGFPMRDLWWNRLLHAGLGYLATIVMLTLVAVHAYGRLRRPADPIVDGRSVCYVFLVLVIGSGLVVNVIFKDHFGRARPREIHEFGGSARFTPAFVVSNQCKRNCSFPSGEGSTGFLGLALARALSRRRGATVAAVAFGTLVSFARMASGAHFLSDVIVSFFVMLIVSDLLYHYMLAPRAIWYRSVAT